MNSSLSDFIDQSLRDSDSFERHWILDMQAIYWRLEQELVEHCSALERLDLGLLKVASCLPSEH